ncbi:MAG TPA: bifunctional adenosylcobinamide kinase/adenosylcobinamide-phosphate guanylyltransferase [Chloroflexota bacterium]|jgi:adenosylcobinamide kinase/adenosylcobinamide-phosphate guanylyltransferase|nr:bifunctional adenosylcobinamide kinase/adenosylcobinamide-phosphate guanylyltransferase [Chloroflexota bacterium]
MGGITLVTGGARSGKSRFAETLATRGRTVCYVATAEALDAEMADRITQHRARRPQQWTTLEAPRDLAAPLAAIRDADTVLVDCLSLWTSNRLLALGDDEAPGWWGDVATLEETLTMELNAIMTQARQSGWDLVLVTNETGFGVVPASRLGRAFRDLLGRLSQVVAAEADAVYLVVAGLAVELKTLAAR